MLDSKQKGIHMKKNTFILMFIFTISMILCGCGKDKDLEQFHTSMDVFLAEVQSISTELENIDTKSETAIQDTLSCLDAYKTSIGNLKGITIPEEFSNIENLIIEAAEYMEKSNTLFHEVYETEPDMEVEDPLEIKFDEEKYQTALEYYNRSMKRINYISLILQGEIDELETLIE